MERMFKGILIENADEQRYEIRGLGNEKLSVAELSTLFSVINQRYENLLPTTTYTNFKAEELISKISCGGESEVIAHAIVSRLWEMEVCAA